VRVEVFDLAGRRVRTLVQGFLPAGAHTTSWNGRTDAGDRAVAGIYFAQMESGDFRATRKVVLLN
jgi:flagellar hook assembly protein FlgD